MSDVDQQRLEELEARYDPEMAFRPTSFWLRRFVTWLLVLLGVYHFYTAGFGIPAEQWHKAIHHTTPPIHKLTYPPPTT